MILVIAPAIDGLRREWREASANLGATPFQFWRYVGVPVLMPSLLGAMVLLFGNSFSAYATAYGLTGGSVQPRADHDRLLPVSGDVPRNPHIGEALAFGMFVVLARDDGRLHPAAADLVAVGAMRTRIAPAAPCSGSLVGAAYFLMPLLATLLFSLKERPDREVLHDRELQRDRRRPGVLEDARQSFVLSIETIVDLARAAHPDRLLGAPEAAAAAAPDRLPRARARSSSRRSSSSSGCSTSTRARRTWFYAQPYGFLVAAYVILAFPYIYFSLDSGFRAIDVHTLTEASQSLGATLARRRSAA